MQLFDLHTHSYMSDGTDSPAELARLAKARGLSLFALTDHDTVCGVTEAVEEGNRIGLDVLPGVEYDVKFDGLMHILGLGIDIYNPEITGAQHAAMQRRDMRNAEILRLLKKHDCDAEPYMEKVRGMTTRMNIARAVVKAGGADSTDEAFKKYLSHGACCYVLGECPTPEEVIDLIHTAGGLAVLAHPCKMKCDMHTLVHELADAGLDGLEVYYPTATPGQTQLFTSLAARYDLLMTCGSDYHGEGRAVQMGDGWEDNPYLNLLHDILMEQCF
ncbi:MAG: PHP domain-containing protein [Clostridia bacterium]